MSSEADLEDNMPSEEMLVDEVCMEKETPTRKELSREQKVLLPAGGTLHQTRDDIHVSPNGKMNKTFSFIDDGNINGVIRNEFYPASPTIEPAMGGIPHEVTPNVRNNKMLLVETELFNKKSFVDNDTSGAPVIAELGTVSNRIPILLANNGTVGGIGTVKQCKVEKGNNKPVIGELGTVSNPIPIDIVGEKSGGTVSIHTRNDFQLGTASKPIEIDKHTSVRPHTLSDRTGNGFENGSANNPIVIDETAVLTHEQLERMERNRLRALCKRRAQQIKQRISESRNRPENVLILIRVIEAVIDMHDACVRPC